MILPVKILITSIIVGIMSLMGVDFFEEDEGTGLLWEINRVLFILSITAFIGTLIWLVWR